MNAFPRMFVLLSLGLIFMAGCLGLDDPNSSNDNNTNNASVRTMTGTIPSSSGSSLSGLHEGGDPGDCAADKVIATDSGGSTVTAEVADDCSFSIELQIGKSYSISFSHEDTFVAVLIFDTGASSTTDNVTIGQGSGPIDIGTITINGNVAIPETEPCEQMDQDGDGLCDCDDSDDDGDDVEDELEEDCDFDGFQDDADEDMDDCLDDGPGDDGDSDSARVIEVKPRNDPQPELGEDRVDLDREIKARINCAVDSETVNEDTFRIESDEVLDCTYEVKYHKNGRHSKITCEPDEDMEPSSLYAAIIEGVECQDGREVETAVWAWLTEPYDDDEGCYEDDYDDWFEALLDEFDDYYDDDEYDDCDCDDDDDDDDDDD